MKDMKFKVDKRKGDVSEMTARVLEKKLGKLDKFFDDDAVAEVKFADVRGMHVVEVTVKSGHMFFRAESKLGDQTAAVDDAVDAIVRQIRKNKTRLEKKLRSGAFERAVDSAEAAAEAGEFSLIRRKHFTLKPMTEEEAVLQMEMLNHRFYLFKNADAGNLICVVYSREDGGYGILISE